jgi:hypothetical protein
VLLDALENTEKQEVQHLETELGVSISDSLELGFVSQSADVACADFAR